jgi:hypothetical protein
MQSNKLTSSGQTPLPARKVVTAETTKNAKAVARAPLYRMNKHALKFYRYLKSTAAKRGTSMVKLYGSMKAATRNKLAKKLKALRESKDHVVGVFANRLGKIHQRAIAAGKTVRGAPGAMWARMRARPAFTKRGPTLNRYFQ